MRKHGSLTFLIPRSNHRSPGVGDCVWGGGYCVPIVVVLVLIVGPKLFVEPGTKAFFRLSSVSGPGL